MGASKSPATTPGSLLCGSACGMDVAGMGGQPAGQELVKPEERVVTVPGEVPADLAGLAGQMR